MEGKNKKRQAEYIGVQEIADILSASYCYARENVVPNVAHIRIGRKILVHEESFRKYLKRLERGA